MAPCPLSSLSFYWALHHNRHVGTKPALRDPLSLASSSPALMKNLIPHCHVKTELVIYFTLLLLKKKKRVAVDVNQLSEF